MALSGVVSEVQHNIGAHLQFSPSTALFDALWQRTPSKFPNDFGREKLERRGYQTVTPTVILPILVKMASCKSVIYLLSKTIVSAGDL